MAREPMHVQDLIASRLSRRALVTGLAGLPLLGLTTGCATPGAAGGAGGPIPSGADFASVPATTADAITLPPGHEAKVLISWGDALFEGDGPFEPASLTREAQERRFGANNDMLALIARDYAFPPRTDAARFALCANNEYISLGLMYPGKPLKFDAAQMAALYASVGVSVVAVERTGADWRVVLDKAPGAGVNRRITPFTPVRFSGPAAAHPWIARAGEIVRQAEPGAGAGLVPCGTLANCAGGVTPWGTYLSSEENFNNFFALSDAGAPGARAARQDPALVLDAEAFGYPLFDNTIPAQAVPAQFDIARNPTGPALYGWVVEIDPNDPSWAPRKRTALGRRKGECATTALARDGRVVVYSGDDQANEFVYKFVSTGKFNPSDRLANRDLLDQGQLYVARLEEDGTGAWVAITAAAANAAAIEAEHAARFSDAGDVAVRARIAARLLGATPMDRPEDVEAVLDETWTGQGAVMIVCTRNTELGYGGPGNPRRPDPARPGRAQANVAGHILKLEEAQGDCASLTFTWDVFALGGDPAATAPVASLRSGAAGHVAVTYRDAPTTTGARFACPDNLCLSTKTNLAWVTTDGSDEVFADCNDAVLAIPLAEGPGPKPVKRFLVGPIGCELTGPVLSPDERTFFAAIQHPGESNVAGVNFIDARLADPAVKPFSTFPDGGWPRSSVIYVRRLDGGVIGA